MHRITLILGTYYSCSCWHPGGVEFGDHRSSEHTLYNITEKDGGVSKPDPQTISRSWFSPNEDENRTFKESAGKSYKGAGERPVCTGSEDLKSTDGSYTDVSQVRISYNVNKAVYAIAHALHQLLECDSFGPNPGKGRCRNSKPFTPRQVS